MCHQIKVFLCQHSYHLHSWLTTTTCVDAASLCPVAWGLSPFTLCLQKSLTEDMYCAGLQQSRLHVEELVHLEGDLEWLRREVAFLESLCEHTQAGPRRLRS
jgi:hypothetical protein